MLYLVATPIGNFEDITIRATKVLTLVDFILCEDSRVSGILLQKLGITKKLVSFHKFNENETADRFVEELKNGANIALISDAGMPLISDPGFPLVRKAVESNVAITVVPGANAALSALLLSAISANKFLFYGFLAHQENKVRSELIKLKGFPYTIIFYEAPSRVGSTLKQLYEAFGDRQIAISREITKPYEETIRGSLAQLVALDKTYKGEVVIVVSGVSEDAPREYEESTLQQAYQSYLELGLSNKEALKKLSEEKNISKNTLYEILNKK